MNYKQLYAIKQTNEKRIKKLVPNMMDASGIYVWWRKDENDLIRFYAGQSKNLVERSISHLMQYDHLGLSIKKHGLYDSEKNPNGWHLVYRYCSMLDLDEEEQKEIMRWCEQPKTIPYNVTGGGQGSKSDLIEQNRKQPKTYTEGKQVGAEQTRKYVQEMFTKYLKFEMLEPTNKIKERKLQEFLEWLMGENNENGNEL